MNYNYPGELGKEILKAMSNTKSTELDKEFEYKNDPSLTKDIKVLCLIVFTVLCVVGTVIAIWFGRVGMWDNI